jgi:hypothetical protein
MESAERIASPAAVILPPGPARAWPCLVRSEKEPWTLNDQPLLRAIEKESLSVIKAYFEGGVAIRRDTFRHAAQANRLDVLQWLYSLLTCAGAAVPKKPDLFARVSLRFNVWLLRRAADPAQLGLLRKHFELACELKRNAGALSDARPLCAWLDDHVLQPLACISYLCY